MSFQCAHTEQALTSHEIKDLCRIIYVETIFISAMQRGKFIQQIKRYFKVLQILLGRGVRGRTKGAKCEGENIFEL